MLKTSTPLEKLISNRLKVDDDEGDDGIDSIEIAKKLEKLKGQKLFKSWKPAKSGNNLSKNGNSPNFNAKNSKPSFLTSKTMASFNRLRLAFIKALIF